MENQLVIRAAALTDIDKMVEIEHSAAEVFSILPLAFLEKLPDNIPHHDKSFYQSMISSGSSWVICINDKIAGFICTKEVPEENTLHIEEFDIDRSFQRTGLGGKLLNFVIDIGKQKNISDITLTTFKEVPWNMPFYKKHGFSIVDQVNLNDRLNTILREEIRIGFPEGTRCAMALAVIN